jgi:hypothetical protein
MVSLNLSGCRMARRQPCWIGVDLSSEEYLTPYVATSPSDGDNGRAYDVLVQFFLPEANLARKAEKDRADYLRWATAGLLTLTPGNVVDDEAQVDHIADLATRFSVQDDRPMEFGGREFPPSGARLHCRAIRPRLHEHGGPRPRA